MKTESSRGDIPARVAPSIGRQALDGPRRRQVRAGELDKRRLLAALTRLKKGYFDVRLPEDQLGLDGKIADAFNEVVELHQAMSRELERLSHAVGKQGRLSERASLAGVGGSWAASMQSVNALIGDLVHPISETARVIGAVAKGDLSQSMALETDGRPLKGEFLSTARTVNTMVDQLSSFASEVTRVAREVGTEGKLGGQARVEGVSGTWKDLTDNVNLMASNLTAQVRNIAAVTTAKDEFLTTLSHELRTPLSAILGWARTLRSGRLDEARAGHGLEVIERNVVAQTKLIDDLLDVSRIITGKLRLSVRQASLVSVVEAACDALRPAAQAREIEIAFERRIPEGEETISGDPDRLQQIFWNLLSNAIKFTPSRGRVTVSLEKSGGVFEVRVRDTGRGIRHEFLEHVFERFRQADSTTTRSQGGLGIGLAIARLLAELHGGSISAQSPGEGQGATFVVQLPAMAVNLDSTGSRRGARSPKSASPKKELADLGGISVLVVEDEPDGRELLEETLRLAGAEVVSVESVKEALEALRRRVPDVLVSDIGLPQEDGYSLIGRVRRLPAREGGRIPALAVSAYVRDEDRSQALAAGFQKHLSKPFEPSVLVAAVARLAGRRTPAPLSLSGFPAATAKEPREAEVRDPGSALLSRVLVVEDDKDSREGLRELLQVWGHCVEVAEDGAQGIEKAIENPPGIALIDIGLPGLDGYQVALRIREAFGERPITLVALTGYADSEDRLRARESGFDAHLPKPINADKLNSLLKGTGAFKVQEIQS